MGIADRDYAREDWEGSSYGYRGWGAAQWLVAITVGILVFESLLQVYAPALLRGWGDLFYVHPVDVVSNFKVWQLFTAPLCSRGFPGSLPAFLMFVFDMVILW